VSIGQLFASQDSRGQLLISTGSVQDLIRSNSVITSASKPQREATQEPRQDSALALSVRMSEPETSSVAPVEKLPARPGSVESSQASDLLSASPRIDIHELVSKLAEAQAQLESASYRVGFLEAELASNEQKIRLLP